MSAFSLHCLGRVALVQVQAASLKVGRRPDSRYDPAPLTPVERLVVTPGGVIGITNDGREIVDVHHADHSESRQGRDGRNGVSIGFTSHYEAIRARFGDHLANGCGGENIVIEPDDTGRVFTLADLGRRLVFAAPEEDSAKGRPPVALGRLMIAAPCVEFGGYVAGSTPLSGAQMRDVLDFLHHGRRGFYATLEGDPATTRAGDIVFAERADR
jgi:hypothetical protein